MVRKLKLLQTHTVVFKRIGSASEKPYVDEYGKTVTPSTIELITAHGSLQPRSKANNRLNTEAGAREQDFMSFFTKVDLRTVDQVGNNLADTCTIGDKEFKVTREGPWVGFSLTPDHHEYFLQLIQPFGS